MILNTVYADKYQRLWGTFISFKRSYKGSVFAMFKASIVENQNYYKLRIISTTIGVFGFAFYYLFIPTDISLWILIPVLFVAIIFFIKFSKSLQAKMARLFGRRRIILDYDEILIKEGKHKNLQKISVKFVDSITIRSDFAPHQETIKEVFSEIFKRQYKVNEIEIIDHGQEYRFNFEFDSYYMIKQLEKIISYWKNQGIQVSVKPSIVNE